MVFESFVQRLDTVVVQILSLHTQKRPFLKLASKSKRFRGVGPGTSGSKWWKSSGRMCWAGKHISDWRKHQESGESWTNGCATDYGRSSLNIGSGLRRSTESSKHLVRTKMLPNGWRRTVAAGGATAPCC